MVKLFNNYNILTSYSYELQAKSDKLQFPSMFIDHKQQLTFLQRFELIGLYPA